MFAQMTRIEKFARMSMGDNHGSDPLPPGPNYGPFGYFRLAMLIMAGVVAVLFLMTVF